MHAYKTILSYLFVFLFLTACSDRYNFTLTTTNKVVLNEKATASLKEDSGKAIDSVQFYVNGQQIPSTNNSATIETVKFGVGKHVVSALVFYPEKTKKINNSIEVLANKAYDIYSYEIVNTYPHDPKAYTQGLQYYNGFLYESTGRKGSSSIRKVELKTGKILQKTDIDDKYFGEGMTILNNKIYFLTWVSKMGFVYNLESFKKESQFSYGTSREGWGITNNGSELIKSDGSSKLWFLDPTTLKEKRHINVYTDKNAIKDLNELEYIHGKIYANYWKQPLIAIINPDNGIVEGIANLTGLQEQVIKDEKLTDTDAVLNGIAFDAENNRIFITGKLWGKVYEIKLVKK